MDKTKFYEKCERAALFQILREKGYEVFEKGYYNLNIIGIRSDQKGKGTSADPRAPFCFFFQTGR